MLFNSYEFLFVFFPSTVVLFVLLRRTGGRSHYVVLLIASLLFYAWWDVRFLPLLVASFTINFIAGHCIHAFTKAGRQRAADTTVASSVALNLVVLGIFKYAHFFVANVNFVAGTDLAFSTIILPLGISFFTFEQIGFLVDVRRGRARPTDPLSYALFVSFFPRLVAGPILRYDEIAPQFEIRHEIRTWDDLAIGLTFFFIGLVKKSFLADGIAPYATSVFQASGHGIPQDLLLAWGGALSYTCQLYFDFSGYSDMAIGLARCFGIRFPMNFYSPYKSGSMIEFWRRWHISLSRFLRDYLYIPLGGNRRGPARRYVNLLATMLLGGLWHGASWTFVFWGGLHGLYLMVNHAWLALAEKNAAAAAIRRTASFRALAPVATFVAVVVAWIFFRAPTFRAAVAMVRGMAGLNGIAIPEGLRFALEPVHGMVAALGVRFADESGTMFVHTYLWLVALLTLAFLAPSTQQLLARYEPVLEARGIPRLEREPSGALFDWRWSLSLPFALAAGALAFLGIISITRVSEFLYWQF